MFNLTKLKRTVKCNKWKKIVALFFHLNLLLHRSSLNNFHVFVLIVSNIVNVQVIVTDTSTFDCLSIHGTQKAHFVQVLGFERTSDFKIQRRGRQRERHKDNRFNKQNNNFARTSHFFLYISFPFLHEYDVKMPNFAFYGERKQATTKFEFWFWA